MDNAQYSKLFSLIWNIANDVLVIAFEKGDYKNIILPFTVLRRIDVLYGAGKMMGIPLIDHIIITDKSHYSFADNGRLCGKE